jgi:hypothetical protein
MAREGLWHCCNTCKYKVAKSVDYRECTISHRCYNGFSAYEPNEEMIKYEEEQREKMRTEQEL